MTLLTIESMAHFVSETSFGTKNGWLPSPSTQFDGPAGGFAGRYACSDTALGMGTNRRLEYAIPAADRHATVWFGANIRFNAGATQYVGRFTSDATATEHIEVRRNNTNASLEVRRGLSGTLLGSTANGTFPDSAYSFVEIGVTLHDTAGVVEIWKDGTRLLNLTGVDTKNGGTSTVLQSVVHGGTGENKTLGRVDDYYLLTGAGASFTTRLGPVGVHAYRPRAEGTHSAWTPSTGTNNATTIDEFSFTSGTGMPDTSDYNGSSANGAKDTFEFAWNVHVTDILAVQLISYALGSGDTLTPLARFNGTDYTGPATTLSGSYQYAEWLMTQHPSGVPWTWANLTNTEFGYQLGGSAAARVAQTVVEVMGRRRCGVASIGQLAGA